MQRIKFHLVTPYCEHHTSTTRGRDYAWAIVKVYNLASVIRPMIDVAYRSDRKQAEALKKFMEAHSHYKCKVEIYPVERITQYDDLDKVKVALDRFTKELNYLDATIPEIPQDAIQQQMDYQRYLYRACHRLRDQVKRLEEMKGSVHP